MSARTELAAHLTAALPDYSVIDTGRLPERVTKRTVVPWQQDMRPADAGRDSILLTLTVAVLTQYTDTRIEDDLEAAVVEVCAAINADARFGWTDAQRAVFEDVDPGHGYKITVLAGGEATLTGGTP